MTDVEKTTSKEKPGHMWKHQGESREEDMAESKGQSFPGGFPGKEGAGQGRQAEQV